MSSESASVRPEVAAFRRRALSAEARVKELESSLGGEPTDVSALKRENAQLKERVDAATARTRQLLDRVRFVRQQATKGEK